MSYVTAVVQKLKFINPRKHVFKLFFTVVGQKPQFERSNQTYQRSESRRNVELTCVVYNVTATMEVSHAGKFYDLFT